MLKTTGKWKVKPHKQVKGCRWKMDAIHEARGKCGKKKQASMNHREASKSGQQMPKRQVVLSQHSGVRIDREMSLTAFQSLLVSNYSKKALPNGVIFCLCCNE